METNFICQCIKLDLQNRQFSGPYPICDVSSIEKMIDDDLGKKLKLYEAELIKKYPDHNPMNDAMRCGLKWIFLQNNL